MRVTGDLENLSFIKAEFALDGRDDYQAMAVKDFEAGTNPNILQPLGQRKQLDLLSSEQKCESMKFRIAFRAKDRKKIKINKCSLIVKVLTNQFNVAEALRIG